MPTGLTLVHTRAWYGPSQPGTCAWKHQTSVCADGADLQVVACGSFIWWDSTGWHLNLPETPAEFARLFECSGGRRRRGHTYTFRCNYCYATAGHL